MQTVLGLYKMYMLVGLVFCSCKCLHECCLSVANSGGQQIGSNHASIRLQWHLFGSAQSAAVCIRLPVYTAWQHSACSSS